MLITSNILPTISNNIEDLTNNQQNLLQPLLLHDFGRCFRYNIFKDCPQGGINVKDFKMKIPVGAQKIIVILERNRFEAYVVGGCVRDAVLGREPKDYDICTSATPEQMKALFKSNRYQTYDTGIQHGTISVNPKDGDIYQRLALDALANNQITMLRGAAGTGKSYLAFGHMFSLLEQGKIDKIIVFCNTVATKGSAKLGFYPGSRTEKLLDSQIGNLLESKLGDRFMVEKLISEGSLVLLPMSDIRGYDTTGMNAAIYISEAQNLDIELMRLALQRIGEDSICILDGDSNTQVDLSMYAGRNNGMKRVSKIFRGSDVYGEVTLVNIHRSKIANLAQQL